MSGMLNVVFDWATGDRTWGEHVHPRFGGEPISYAGAHEWARARLRKHKMVKCLTAGCPIMRWDDEPNEPQS